MAFQRKGIGVDLTERSASQQHFLDRLRRAWLDPEGASDTELKKRTLTNRYSVRAAWLQHAPAARDGAVWAACGRDDADPATTERASRTR